MSTVSITAPPAGLPARVAAHALATPTALAVHDGINSLTYHQLNSAARKFAGVLSARGVEAGTAVGLLLPHGIQSVVAQLAVWWAGGHYVPLDPAYPDERITAMLTETGAVLTIGDPELLAAAPIPPETSLALSAVPPIPLNSELDELPAARPWDPEATAYVIYTSGSTGRPKGAALTHRGVELMATGIPCSPLLPEDRVLFHSPMAFDASAFEVWAPLANGATVVVCASGRPAVEHLATEAAHLGVTVAFLTTSLFHHLAARGSALFGLVRTVVTGGEALSASHARGVLRAHPTLELVNAYGPSESTTFATAHHVRDEDCDAPPPIGRSLPGASTHVLDDCMRQVPHGVRGELWISGPRLAAGYVAQPALTAERFIEPSGRTPQGAGSAAAWDGRLYRTGDLVSTRADGALEFHGRSDDQVKVRGHRIEPGEIEHALDCHPAVREAVVVVRRSSAEDARLTAYIIPASGASWEPGSLREYLAARLPAHLIPSNWAVVDGFPFTAGGKVDRRALAERPLPMKLGNTQDGTPSPGPGLSPLQQVVADAWSAALGLPVDRPDANFFDLGGHSLLALTVVEDLRDDLGAEIALAAFYATPTVAGHSALLEAALRKEDR